MSSPDAPLLSLRKTLAPFPPVFRRDSGETRPRRRETKPK